LIALCPTSEEQPPAHLSRSIRGLQVTLASRENYEKTVHGLGSICVEFQRLESFLKLATPILVNPKDLHLGKVITAELSVRATLDLLYALYHYRFNDPEELKELQNFLNECAKAEEDRNRFIHSRRNIDIDAGKGAIRIKHTARNRKEFRSQKETLLPADKRGLSISRRTTDGYGSPRYGHAFRCKSTHN
jgi:hypothetical protein